MKYILLLLLLLPEISAHAQRMYIESGSIYIESFGVRSDLVSPAPALKQQKLSDNSLRTVYHKGISTPQNILIGRKLQIAKKDAKPVSDKNFYVLSGLKDGEDGRPGMPMAARGSDGWGCDEYTEKTDESDKGKWRVPTINEYILMGLYITDFNLVLNLDGFVLPSMQFIGGGYNQWRKMNFIYISSTTYEGDDNQMYYFQWYPGYLGKVVDHNSKTTPGRVRCVKDIE